MQCTFSPSKHVQSVETRNLKRNQRFWKEVQLPTTKDTQIKQRSVGADSPRYQEPTGRDDTIRGQPLPPPCLPSPRAASRQGLEKGRSPRRAVQEGSGQVHLGPATLPGEAVPALLAAVFKQRGQTVSKQPARCLQTPHTFQKAWACPSVCGWEGAQEPESS